jgi:pimeloyl-ACP methyl ester carboxylesterase
MRLNESKPHIPVEVASSLQEAVTPREPPPTVVRARDHANAAFHAVRSYSDEKTIVGDRPTEKVKYFTYSVTELAAYGEMQGDRAIIAFRGTLVDRKANWLVDINCKFRGKPSRHRGFYDGWESLRPEITQWLEARAPKSITLTGHSLGGAMAVLAAYELAERWLIAEVTVFGCPRTGTGAFAQSYDSRNAGPGADTKLAAITTRYVMATDLVSRVPPPLVFAHVGKAIHVNESGNRIDSPMPLAARVVQTTLAPQPDDPSPTSIEGGLLAVLRPLGPAAMAMAMPIWGAIAFFGVLTGLALRRDGMMHAAEKYRRALNSRLYIIERNPGLAAIV